MAKLLQVFLNADLRCSHDGLTSLAKKEKVDVSQLTPGEYVIFINSGKNRIKLFAANNVLAYLRLPQGKIDMRTISLIPRAFEASRKINYDEKLREVLTKELRLK